MTSIREKLEAMNDGDLVKVANELKQTVLAADALCRQLIPEKSPFAFSIIEISAELTQVLAERLKACSPHIQK